MPDPRISPEGDDASVRSVKRALAILRAFGPDDERLALGEIARRSRLDKATARRLLRTLIGESIIFQHAATKEYSLDLGVLELSAGATPVDLLRRRSQPVLCALANSTGSRALIVVPHAGAALCIAAIAGEGPLHVPWCPGQSLPLHACAASRVLMAYMPMEARMTALAGPLPARTTTTPTDPFQLSTTLATIREREWETSLDELAKGVAVLAVPVHGKAGDVIAAMAIGGPPDDLLEGYHRPRHLTAVQSKVRELERRLGDQRAY